MDEKETRGVERRSFLKGAAVVAGTTVWATPTIQSMVAPAVAASPLCVDDYVRFKYDVQENLFDNGDAGGGGANWCLPDGYADADPLPNTTGNTLTFTVNGKTVTITIEILDDGKTAKITITGQVLNVDFSAKAGSINQDVCGETDMYVDDFPGVVYLTITKDISFVAGTLCIPE